MTAQPSLMTLARRSFWLLFGGLWLFVGVAMLIFALGFAVKEGDYTRNGVTTTGIVLTKHIVPADSDSSTEYRVSYRFSTGDGRVVEGSDTIDSGAWEKLVERGPIEIRYVADNPGSNRLASGSNVAGAAIFALLGAVFGGIGAVLFIRAIQGVRKARRLLQVGIPAQGKVTGIEETNIQFNRRQQFKVRYSYVDREGRKHEGDSGYMDWTEATDWVVGDPVDIRYDPADPDQSSWIGRPAPAASTVLDVPPPGPDAPPAPTAPPSPPASRA